jgi:hypothetical protein
VKDYCKKVKKAMRQLSKGMGGNLDSQIKNNKKELLQNIKVLDDKAEQQDLSGKEWRDIYKLDGELEEIFTCERPFGSN